jgi:hypothetical protein
MISERNRHFLGEKKLFHLEFPMQGEGFSRFLNRVRSRHIFTEEDIPLFY